MALTVRFGAGATFLAVAACDVAVFGLTGARRVALAALVGALVRVAVVRAVAVGFLATAFLRAWVPFVAAVVVDGRRLMAFTGDRLGVDAALRVDGVFAGLAGRPAFSALVFLLDAAVRRGDGEVARFVAVGVAPRWRAGVVDRADERAFPERRAMGRLLPI